jgi:uncharacterized surface protein with fasciclin (FAS1) repeats
MSSFVSSMCIVGLGVVVLAGSNAAAAPCKGSRTTTTGGHPVHVVQPAVIHERVISSRVIHQASFADAPKDIVDTAVGVGTFKTLAAALGAADLIGTLKGDGPFTVFAPSDEAFAKLPAGTVENLLKPENKEKLKEILLLHVVPGNVYAADVVKLTEAKTAGGKVVKVSTDGGVKVGTATGLANVVKTDIKAKNGVIHVIDAVILP